MKIIQGEIYIDDVDAFIKKIPNGCVLTFINADYVIDLGVVEFAIKKAIKSWKEGRRIAKTLSMEILLYYSATRQIKDALKLGLKNGLNRVVAVVEDCEEWLKDAGFVEKNVLDKDIKDEKIEKIKRIYDISDEEIEIVGKEKLPLLIRERIVLFDLYRKI